jgi:hypothetical protein
MPVHRHKGVTDQALILEAVQGVKNGFFANARGAAGALEVPYSTLTRRLRGGNPSNSRGGLNKALDPQQESALIL